MFLRILVFSFHSFIIPGKNKSFTCNYFLSGITILGSPVSGLRFQNRLMQYDLEPLRETELSDLRTDGIVQAPITNFFSFFSGGMGTGAKQKEMIISPYGSLPGKERYNLWTLFSPEAKEIFNDINTGHFQAKKIFKKLKSEEQKWLSHKVKDIKYCRVSKYLRGRNWCLE